MADHPAQIRPFSQPRISPSSPSSFTSNLGNTPSNIPTPLGESDFNVEANPDIHNHANNDSIKINMKSSSHSIVDKHDNKFPSTPIRPPRRPRVQDTSFLSTVDPREVMDYIRSSPLSDSDPDQAIKSDGKSNLDGNANRSSKFPESQHPYPTPSLVRETPFKRLKRDSILYTNNNNIPSRTSTPNSTFASSVKAGLGNRKLKLRERSRNSLGIVVKGEKSRMDWPWSDDDVDNKDDNDYDDNGESVETTCSPEQTRAFDAKLLNGGLMGSGSKTDQITEEQQHSHHLTSAQTPDTDDITEDGPGTLLVTTEYDTHLANPAEQPNDGPHTHGVERHASEDVPHPMAEGSQHLPQPLSHEYNSFGQSNNQIPTIGPSSSVNMPPTNNLPRGNLDQYRMVDNNPYQGPQSNLPVFPANTYLPTIPVNRPWVPAFNVAMPSFVHDSSPLSNPTVSSSSSQPIPQQPPIPPVGYQYPISPPANPDEVEEPQIINLRRLLQAKEVVESLQDKIRELESEKEWCYKGLYWTNTIADKFVPLDSYWPISTTLAKLCGQYMEAPGPFINLQNIPPFYALLRDLAAIVESPLPTFQSLSTCPIMETIFYRCIRILMHWYDPIKPIKIDTANDNNPVPTPSTIEFLRPPNVLWAFVHIGEPTLYQPLLNAIRTSMWSCPATRRGVSLLLLLGRLQGVEMRIGTRNKVWARNFGRSLENDQRTLPNIPNVVGAGSIIGRVGIIEVAGVLKFLKETKIAEQNRRRLETRQIYQVEPMGRARRSDAGSFKGKGKNKEVNEDGDSVADGSEGGKRGRKRKSTDE